MSQTEKFLMEQIWLQQILINSKKIYNKILNGEIPKKRIYYKKALMEIEQALEIMPLIKTNKNLMKKVEQEVHMIVDKIKMLLENNLSSDIVVKMPDGKLMFGGKE